MIFYGSKKKNPCISGQNDLIEKQQQKNRLYSAGASFRFLFLIEPAGFAMYLIKKTTGDLE